MTNNTPKQNCENKNCSYFLDKKTLSLYRGKFLTSIIVLIIFVAAIFTFLNISYVNSQNKIVNSHTIFCNQILKSTKNRNFTDKDFQKRLCDIIEANNIQTQRQLDLQYEKIQTDFTVLSLWAGILMIVFLIFSIYSMFKTDEMLKQSKEGLRHITENSEKVDSTMKEIEQKIGDAIKRIDEQTETERKNLINSNQEELKRIKNLIEKIQKEFEDSVENKTKEFNTSYDKYLKAMKDHDNIRNNLIKELLTEFANKDSGMKDSGIKDSGIKDSGIKDSGIKDSVPEQGSSK